MFRDLEVTAKEGRRSRAMPAMLAARSNAWNRRRNTRPNQVRAATGRQEVGRYFHTLEYLEPGRPRDLGQFALDAVDVLELLDTRQDARQLRH